MDVGNRKAEGCNQPWLGPGSLDISRQQARVSAVPALVIALDLEASDLGESAVWLAAGYVGVLAVR